MSIRGFKFLFNNNVLGEPTYNLMLQKPACLNRICGLKTMKAEKFISNVVGRRQRRCFAVNYALCRSMAEEVYAQKGGGTYFCFGSAIIQILKRLTMNNQNLMVTRAMGHVERGQKWKPR